MRLSSNVEDINDQEWGRLRKTLRTIIESKACEMVLGAVIVSNMVVVIFETDTTSRGEKIPVWLNAANQALLGTYVVELIAKLYTYQLRFFHDGWNIMDFLIVGSDIVLFLIDLVYKSLPKMTFLRVIRLVRLVRAFKAASRFKELEMILRGFVRAFNAIFWGVLLLLILLTIWSILAVQLINPINQDVAKLSTRYSDCQRCPRAFESVFQSLLTFFQTVVAGDSWGEVAVPIIEHYPPAGIFFLCVIVSISLAIMNLILAVIVDSANESRSGMNDDNSEDCCAILKRLCVSLDAEGYGALSKDELRRAMEENTDDARVLRECLKAEDVDEIFEVLDLAKSGFVKQSEFVAFFSKMRQSGNISLMLEVTKLGRMIQQALDFKPSSREMPASATIAGSSSTEAMSVSKVANCVAAVHLEVPQQENNCLKPELEAPRKLLPPVSSEALLVQDCATQFEKFSEPVVFKATCHENHLYSTAIGEQNVDYHKRGPPHTRMNSAVRPVDQPGGDNPLDEENIDNNDRTDKNNRNEKEVTNNDSLAIREAQVDVNMHIVPQIQTQNSATFSATSSHTTRSIALPGCKDHDEERKYTLWPSWEPNSAMMSTRVGSTVTSLEWELDSDESEKIELEAEDVDNYKPWICMTTPDSRRRIAWDLTSVLILSWDLVMIPLQLSFSITETPLIKVMTNFGMCFWTTDLLFTFFVGFYNQRGNIEMRPLRIAKRYMKTWFILDLLIVSLDWFMVVLASQGENTGFMQFGKLFRTLRILRTLRLLRLAKLKQIMDFIQDRLDSEFLTIGLNVLKLMMLIVAINHFIACFWFALGKQSVDNFDSWVTVYNFSEHPVPYQYLSSLHWSLTQFTPASMNVQPVNVNERLFAVLVLLFAMIVFSSFVSSITTAMNQLRNLTAKNSSHLWLLRKYLREQGIPLELKARLIRYATISAEKLHNKVQRKDVCYLSLLSTPLQAELTSALYFPILKENPLFERLHRKCVALMHKVCCKAVRSMSLSRGDILFHSGEEASAMYFITHGQMKYAPAGSQSETELETFKPQTPNSWCSEAVLWVPWVHCGKMRAGKESDLIVIDGSQFRELALLYPAHHHWLREHALQFVEILKQMDEKHQDFGPVVDTVRTSRSGNSLSPIG